ncbi:SPOSA6832_03076 [Sporobolomyces salmonicolor]|uniref:SPOSA6832_03076-mRNA-1:cds n=1 Tax=Sporidiobolus salmonicolor TaxID=5005 RepID=A0A0D6EP52_SPOSA|nr:SPOSA6832_03076 [Sporobolomyces salmonicolor]
MLPYTASCGAPQLSGTDTPAQTARAVLLGAKDAGHLAEATLEPSVMAVGRRESAYYEKLVPEWRYRIREKLLKSLEDEMAALVQVQTSWRTPFRDEYFVKTSLLGTHTFFMVFIPIWAWFGFPECHTDRCTQTGGYITSVLKDAFCVPRPFSPPVIRLSVGSHALEYGFPSTHSSNACSMALFFGELLLRRNPGQFWVNAIGVALLAAFAWSVTFGRLYTGMHSMMDVGVGSAFGVLTWLVLWLSGDAMESVVRDSRLTGPSSSLFFSIFDLADLTIHPAGSFFIVPILLLLVTFHPQPAENCPCFEDAIAFMAVFAGILLGLAWSPEPHATQTLGYTWKSGDEVAAWSAATGAKLALGVCYILLWRVIAKEVCHLVLPPLFRFFAPIISLPRRFYVAATECEPFLSRSSSCEFVLTALDFADGAYPRETSLHAVPSILDLPSLVEDSEVATSSSSSAAILAPSPDSSTLRNRSSFAPTSSLDSPSLSGTTLSANGKTDPEPRSPSSTAAAATAERQLHLDADVLTKVVVYAGIGWMATVTLPWLFEQVGLSVWPIGSDPTVM